MSGGMNFAKCPNARPERREAEGLTNANRTRHSASAPGRWLGGLVTNSSLSPTASYVHQPPSELPQCSVCGVGDLVVSNVWVPEVRQLLTYEPKILLCARLTHEAKFQRATRLDKRMTATGVWFATAIPAPSLQCRSQATRLGSLGTLKATLTEVTVRQGIAHNVRGVNGCLSFLTSIAKHIKLWRIPPNAADEP